MKTTTQLATRHGDAIGPRDISDDPTLVLSDDMTADDVADWDSLHHLVLISTVQSAFGMKFRTTEIERLTTVGDLVGTVERRVR